jgi:hypothetical protein
MITALCSLKLNAIMGAQLSSGIVNFKSKDFLMSQDSSIGVVTDYGLDGWGSIPGRGEIFLFSTVSRPALGPSQPPVQWVMGAPSRGRVSKAVKA